MAQIRGEGPQKDIDEIVRLHNLWVKANRTGSIPMMRDAFVGGDKFFGWNLNGFAYDGIEEWATLWEWLAKFKANATLGEDEDLRVRVRGDMGWLSCTAPFTITLADGTAAAGQRQVPQHRGLRARGRQGQAGLEDVALPLFVVRDRPADGLRERGVERWPKFANSASVAKARIRARS